MTTIRVKGGAVLAGAALLWCAGAAAEGAPPLWGYGVKSCDDYAKVWKDWDAGLPEGVGEYLRYQDWLTGFVSGLNLATGQDVLAGVEIDSALRRVRLYCDDHRKEDFFAAVMDLVRLLSKLK